MKKKNNQKSAPHLFITRLIFILIFFVPIVHLTAQSCLPDSTVFKTQEEIDNFALNYPGCTEIEGSLTIVDLDGHSILNLDGLAPITSIGGALTISYNYDLVSIEGLNSLTAIGGDLEMVYNSSLPSLTGLNVLETIGGDLYFEKNHSLIDFTGMEVLMTIEGHMGIGECASLKNANGLENLTVVNSLNFYDNDALESLDGMEGLNSVNTDLYIWYNSALENLDGLINLTSINGQLEIINNSMLNSIDGIKNIEHTTILSLGIHGHPNLSDCSKPNICAYVSIPTNEGGAVNNATGCNGHAEILAGCLVPVYQAGSELAVSIYPNPVMDALQIENISTKMVSYEVVDNLGRVVLNGEVDSESLDVSKLLKGIYYLKLNSDDQSASLRFVKQ